MVHCCVEMVGSRSSTAKDLHVLHTSAKVFEFAATVDVVTTVNRIV